MLNEVQSVKHVSPVAKNERSCFNWKQYDQFFFKKKAKLFVCTTVIIIGDYFSDFFFF